MLYDLKPYVLLCSSAAQSNGSRPQPQKRSGFRFGSQKDEDEEEEPQEKAGNALKGFFGSKKVHSYNISRFLEYRIGL